MPTGLAALVNTPDAHYMHCPLILFVLVHFYSSITPTHPSACLRKTTRLVLHPPPLLLLVEGMQH